MQKPSGLYASLGANGQELVATGGGGTGVEKGPGEAAVRRGGWRGRPKEEQGLRMALAGGGGQGAVAAQGAREL